MANDFPLHLALPKDKRIWKLTWLCDLAYSPHIPNEYLLRLLLSPLIDPATEYEKLNSTLSYNVWQNRLVDVGIGALPVFKVGSFWRGGKPYVPVPPAADPTQTVHQVMRLHIPPIPFPLNQQDPDIELIQSNSKRFNPNRKDTARYYIPASHHSLRVGNTFPAKTMQTLSLRVKCEQLNERGEVTGKIFAVIPCAEIFRFYYANSTPLTHRLLNLGTEMDDLCNTTSSYLDTDTRKAFIKLRMRLLDSDALTVARLAFSPEAARRAMFTAAKLTRLHADKKLMVIEAYPPFECETQWQVSGKHLDEDKLSEEHSFLVYEIHTCTAPLPFTKLTFSRDNEGRKSTEPETAEEHDAKPVAFPNAQRSSHKIPDNLPIDNTDEPARDYEEETVYGNTNRFLAIKPEDVKKVERGATKFRAEHDTRPNRLKSPLALSTADAGYGDGQHAPLTVTQEAQAEENREREKALTASFGAFEEVISTLKNFKTIASCRKIQIIPADIEVIPEKQRSVFPEVEGRGGSLKWSFIKLSEPKQRRQAIIVEVQYKGQNFYLFEAEHRTDKGKDGKLKERFTMLLVSAPGEQSITNAELEKVLNRCVENNGSWLRVNEMRHLKRRKLKHSSKDANQTAKRVVEKMDAIIEDKQRASNTTPSE